VLIGGHSGRGAFLAELDTKGEPVGSFGTGGIAVHDLGEDLGASGKIADLELLPDGRILAAGSAFGTTDTASELVVARFTPGGDLDPTFATGGVFRSNPTDGVDDARALEVQPDGKIVAVGGRGETVDETGDTWLVRLTPDGMLDPSFGTGGEFFAGSAGLDWAQAVALQPDGKAVTAGSFQAPVVGHQLQFGRFTADEVAPSESVKVTLIPTPKPRRCAGKKATLTGTPKADRLVGTNRADVIVALGGNDRVNAKGGRDLICSGAGKDVVKGGAGADRIIAGKGRDRIVGGPGRDVCNGGPGKDVVAASCEL